MRRQRRVLLMLRPPEDSRADYLFLGFLFLLGVVLGHVAGGLVREDQQHELADYVLRYTQASSAENGVSVSGVLFCAFRSPLALYLMGLAACGSWMVPLYVTGQGFFLAYCIHCFSASLGKGGVLLAFAAFGIRCLFIFPCCFFLASRSWGSARQRLRGSSVRDGAASTRGGAFPLIICGIVLLIACIIELSLAPRLFSLILQRYY